MIDDFPESLLLLEIFLRLRNPRDVIVCKSVSKRWNSLISSSSLFDHNSRSLALILNTNPLCATNDLCLEGWKGFQLGNYVDPKFDYPLCALASYRDVLLCRKLSSSSRRKATRAQLYIVNPVTMRWTQLRKTGEEIFVRPIGLSWNGSKDRYYVVTLFKSEPSQLWLTVLDSKRGKWRWRRIEHLPWSQFGWEPTQCQGLNFEGSLHWLAQDGPIVAYNPNYKHECIIIHRSQEMRHASYGNHAVVSETLTVSTGHLRIIQMVCYPLTSDDHHHLAIWTLVDYKKSIWKREHDPIYFSDMVSDLPWIQDYMRGYSLITTNQHGMSLAIKLVAHPPPPLETRRERIICPQPLHCHTNNPLLVYLYLPESIVLLDVATKKLRLVTRVDKTRYMGSRYWTRYDKVIPMTLHSEPSLVPDHERVPCHRHRKIY